MTSVIVRDYAAHQFAIEAKSQGNMRIREVAQYTFTVPTAIPVGPVLPSWLTHAWEADSLVLADGDPVASWVDSIAAVAMVQTTPSLRPTYRAGGGTPYLDFDGTDDWLTSSLGSAQPNSIFVAIKSAVLTPTQSVFFDGQTGNRHLLFEFTGNRLFTLVDAQVRDSGLTAPSTPSLIGARYSGATSQAFRDASAGTVLSLPSTALAGFRVGIGATGVAPLNGEVYAVFAALGHSVTAGEIIELRQYCVDKNYGNPAP